MSKVHEDNAGYVGVSYEETQDPFYGYNKLALPIVESDRTVLRDEVTFTVTVASVSGSNKYFIDGTQQATVSLIEGNVYTFDQSHSSNGTHPLKFSYTADGTWGSGLEYTLGVTTSGTPGQAGAYTRIVVPFGLHDLKYYCGNHPGMGGSANVVKNTQAFTVGRPILNTSDSFGAIAQYTVSGGSFNAGSGLGNIFDGSTSTEANHAGGSSSTFTLTFSPKVQVSNTLEVWLNSGSSKFSVNGGSQTTASSGSWTSLGFTGELSTLAVQGNATGNYAPRLAAIRVDGTVLGCSAEDPFASNLVLAIPMNGVNNDYTFTDVSSLIRGSGSPKTVTRTNALIKTDQSYFYGSSGYYDANSSRLAVANSSDFDFGSGEYTIEVWVYPTDSGTRNIVSRSFTGGTGNYSGFILSTTGFLETVSQSAWDVNISHTLPLNAWSHCAVVRKDNTWTYFVNGVSVGSATAIGAVPDGPSDLMVSYRSGQNDFWGYMQDLRIYKGVAKYTTPFPAGSYGMNAITFTGNGKQRAIGGTKFSDFVTGTQFGTSYSKDRAFNEDLDDRTFASVGTGNLVFTPPEPIPVTTSNGLRLRIKADTSGNSGVLSVNGTDYSSSISTGSNWMTFNVSSLVSIEFGTAVGNGSEQSSLAAIEIDGNILIEGTSSKFNFQPDLVWTSVRDATGYIKYIFDSVRGATKALATSHTQGDDAETTLATSLTSFDSNGFTIGDNSQVNEDDRGMVAWGWKAGGAPTTDNVAGAGNVPTAGSVKIDGANMTTALAGTVAATRLTASTTYGFSIVSWTVGTAPYTVAHGLNAEPYFIITKSRTGNGTNWGTYHKSTGNQSRTYLNLDLGASSGEAVWNSTTPTDSVFTLNTSGEFSGDMVAYCWSEVSNFSKFGMWTGNGLANGPVVDLGFKVRWLLFKRTDQGGDNWTIFDTARDNGTLNVGIQPNNNVEEQTFGNRSIVVSDTGFQVTSTGASSNATGGTYIYAAFAESAAGEGFESAIVDQLDLKDRSGNSNNASNAGATWQTSVQKFYGGAAATNTKRRAMQITSDDFNVGTGDFTLEFWAYSTSSAQEGGVWPRFISTGTNATTSIQVGHIGSATGRIRYTHSDNSQYAHSPDVDFRNQWVHVAVVRKAGEVSVYCNGSRGQTFTDNNAKTSTTMYISGYDANSGAMTGYIQDVKWYSSIAKYTSSFSPPERSVQGTARRYPSGVYVVS